MARLYTPTDVETATGGAVTPTILRDWRRRGLLNDIGRSDEGGRWRYLRGEVCALAVASHLVEKGLTIERAIGFASRMRAAVIAWLTSEPTEFDREIRERHLLVVGYETRGKFQVHQFNDPGHFSDLEIGVCHLVSPRWIAEALASLRRWYNAERATAKRN